jgi:hypothetical protein
MKPHEARVLFWGLVCFRGSFLSEAEETGDEARAKEQPKCL